MDEEYFGKWALERMFLRVGGAVFVLIFEKREKQRII